VTGLRSYDRPVTEDDLPRSPAAAPEPATPGDPPPALIAAADPDAVHGPDDVHGPDPDLGLAAAAAEPERRRRGRPKGSTSSARTTRVVELCLTVSEGADGEWQAELKQGATWISRGLPVSAASVLRAAQELHTELAEPIEAAIGAAREARAARVAALEAELEQARKALAELDA
jgi:Family of unknown function (DUF6319)